MISVEERKSKCFGRKIGHMSASAKNALISPTAETYLMSLLSYHISNKIELSMHEENLIKKISCLIKESKAEKVVFDIGFGNGNSICDHAIKNPNNLYFGIEIYKPGLASALKKIEKNNLTNIYLIEGDVNRIINKMHNIHLHEIYILFPDPWPKRRHNKRRLINSDFLLNLSKILFNHAKIYIATDNACYAKNILETIVSMPCYEIIENTEPNWNEVFFMNTEFCKKAINANNNINKICLLYKKCAIKAYAK